MTLNKEVKPQDVYLEASLLKAMSVRNNYTKFGQYINVKRLLPNTALLLNDYEKYYNSTEDEQINWGLFITEFSQHWHARDLDEDDIQYYVKTVIPTITNADDNDINNIMVGLLDREYTERLHKALSSKLEHTELLNILDEYEKEKSKYVKESKDERAFKASDVIQDTAQHGIEWFLRELRVNNGPIKLGDLIVVFAYNEVGKGAFAVSQVAKTITTKPEQPVLYFTSEDAVRKLYGRVYSCIYNKTYESGFHQIMENYEEVAQKFINDFGEDSLLVYELGFGEIKLIQQEIEKHNPCFVVIDMGDTLCPESEDPGTLKRVYDTLRQLANRKCPIMVTSQANDTSYFSEKDGKMMNKKWLTRNDCYGSKVGKPSAATMMIGIAEDLDMPGYRYIHTPKNKEREKIKITCELIEKYSLYRGI